MTYDIPAFMPSSMSDDDAERVASLIADKLAGAVISAILPPEAVATLADAARAGGYESWQLLPIGIGGFKMKWNINADSTLTLRMMHINGEIFWTGTFHGALSVCRYPGPPRAGARY